MLALAACRDDVRSLAGDVIACQPPGAVTMSPVCGLEAMTTPDGTVLTVRHPDGSFRRLLQVKDGRGVIAADGAEPAMVKSAGNKTIEVAIGGAIYQLPAKVAP
jgi:hypothetical protein